MPVKLTRYPEHIRLAFACRPARACAMRRLLACLTVMLPLAPGVVAQSPPPAPTDRVAGLKAEKRAAIDRALDALTSAATEQEAAPLEARVRQMWLDASSPAVMLLLMRGLRALKGAANADAEQDFQAALVLDPDHSEAWKMAPL